jgi:hypothetical protein
VTSTFVHGPGVYFAPIDNYEKLVRLYPTSEKWRRYVHRALRLADTLHAYLGRAIPRSRSHDLAFSLPD